MRAWAGPMAFVGATISLVFWLFAPVVAAGANSYTHEASEIYLFGVALSGFGIVGSLIAKASNRWAPAFMAIAAVPAFAALFVPGLLLAIAALLALEAPETEIGIGKSGPAR